MARWIAALERGLRVLPALIAGMACLRLAECLLAGAWGLLPAALGADVAALARHGWVILLTATLLSLPASHRVRLLLAGTAWSVLLAAQALLMQYHATTGVPLGADLFAYSAREIATTAQGSVVSPVLLGGLTLALAACWALLARRAPVPALSRGAAGGVLALTLAGVLLTPPQTGLTGERDLHAATLKYDKLGYFADDAAQLFARADASAGKRRALDPDHPFLHAERTPDTLGPYFTLPAGRKPNVVLIVVEGLGRSFSGPGARLGSFTPFLDELAGRSLYFENFLATQGRTFGVLPSLLGSAPFAANGLAALGDAIPAHAALPGILGAQGYATRFYTGSNLDFDNEGLYLRRAGMRELVGEPDFGPGPQRSSEWGYADRDLVDLVLKREQDAPSPRLSVVQTTSMHMPFAFPGKAAYMKRVDERLAQLNVAEPERGEYARQREIYASILYTDDALRHFFEQAKTLPGYAETIFVVTGDHRLPEIPMEHRLERYHVPLLIFSPMLKHAASVKSVSSHFDVAPSLLALLADQAGVRLPARVTWMGTGLDMEPGFRNVHTLPLKQTKTEMSDYVSGTAYLGQDRLYTIADGMQIEPAASAGALARVREQFAEFVAANSALIRTRKLAPQGSLTADQPWRQAGRTLIADEVAGRAADLAADGVRVTPAGGALRIAARFVNRGATATPDFVPLAVLTDDKGRELRETYGKAMQLKAGANAAVTLTMAAPGAGAFFISVIPSDPETGKPLGTGQYHVDIHR